MALSYSTIFVSLWCLAAASCAYFLFSYNREVGKNCGAHNYFYILFSVLLVLFAAFRPIGVSRDDINYLDIFNTICPSISCEKWVQGSRDWGWFSAVGLLKSIWLDPRVMLLLSACGLIVKLWVIYRICRQPMMALLLYAGVFYQILDLTQFRVSLASTFYFVSFYFLYRGKFLVGGALTLFAGLFHKQAFISPLILIGKKLRIQHSMLVVLCSLPIVMMLLGFYPEIPKIIKAFYSDNASGSFFTQGLEMYLESKAAGYYEGWRVAPIVYYPFIALALFLSKDILIEDETLYGYISIGILSGAWILWGFASLPDVQTRFFEFMMMPVVLLAGLCRFDLLRFGTVSTVSGVFIVKYNILHQLIVGSVSH